MAVLSDKFSQLEESQTVALTGLLAELRRQGNDVISLGAGEPDFPTPTHVKRAAIQAIEQDFTHYTPVDGIAELKESISEWLHHKYGVAYANDELVITSGAKHAVYQAILAVCNPGDEVLLPKPFWVSYPEQIKLAGARVVELEPDSHLKIQPETLQRAITRNTKLMILNTPSNPSGVVYSEEELRDIAAVLEQAGVWILSDEIYDELVYDDFPFASMLEFPNMRDRVLYVNGVSKSFAMTGWRIGFLAAPQPVAAVVKKYQGHSTSNPCSISQKAAWEAYRAPKDVLVSMKQEFQKRRDFVYNSLRSIQHVTCPKPQGAFYAFPNVSAYYNKSKGIDSSHEFCNVLLRQFNVAIVPGSAFGMDEHVRLSSASSMPTLQKALERIEHGLHSLATVEF